MAGVKGRSGGRNRLPTELHKLRGQPNKNRINLHEPKYGALVNIEPPTFLDPEAQAEWRRLSPALCAQKLLDEGSATTFAAYCTAFSDWVRAGRQLQEHGDLVATEQSISPSPFVKMKRDAEAAMVRWAREFGFTPQSRAGIVAPHDGEPDDFEKWQMSRNAHWKRKYGTK